MPFFTPDAQAGHTTRPLYIPNSLLPIVSGQLQYLLDSYNWEEFGDLSVDDCIALVQAMVDEYYTGGCGVIGEICFFDTAALPADFLLCDGAEYLRVDYPALYAVIADIYKTDADHFIAPGRMDRFVRGGEEAGIEGGSNTISVNIDNMPSHAHTIQKAYGNDVVSGYLGAISALVITQTPETTSSVGAGDPIVTIPLYTTAMVGIRYR
jgi:microcystin-dependent protein